MSKMLKQKKDSIPKKGMKKQNYEVFSDVEAYGIEEKVASISPKRDKSSEIPRKVKIEIHRKPENEEKRTVESSSTGEEDQKKYTTPDFYLNSENGPDSISENMSGRTGSSNSYSERNHKIDEDCPHPLHEIGEQKNHYSCEYSLDEKEIDIEEEPTQIEQTKPEVRLPSGSPSASSAPIDYPELVRRQLESPIEEEEVNTFKIINLGHDTDLFTRKAIMDSITQKILKNPLNQKNETSWKECWQEVRIVKVIDLNLNLTKNSKNVNPNQTQFSGGKRKLRGFSRFGPPRRKPEQSLVRLNPDWYPRVKIWELLLNQIQTDNLMKIICALDTQFKDTPPKDVLYHNAVCVAEFSEHSFNSRAKGKTLVVKYQKVGKFWMKTPQKNRNTIRMTLIESRVLVGGSSGGELGKKSYESPRTRSFTEFMSEASSSKKKVKSTTLEFEEKKRTKKKSQFDKLISPVNIQKIKKN